MADKPLDVLELQQQLTDAEITVLVHAFYERVRLDTVLGPVFAARIADGAWPRHLDKMVRFWSTVLRGTNRYRGDPIAAHTGLPGVGDAHVARWLALFRETAAAALSPRVAASVVHRAERMAVPLRAALSRAAG